MPTSQHSIRPETQLFRGVPGGREGNFRLKYMSVRVSARDSLEAAFIETAGYTDDGSGRACLVAGLRERGLGLRSLTEDIGTSSALAS